MGSTLRRQAVVKRAIYRVSFDEAQTVFTDTFSLTVADPHHSDEEKRFVILGVSTNNRLLVVSYAERPQIIRLISARKATRHERKRYEQSGYD